jgi:dipeptidyl aminopeptidase/acylaminoacyl peptidase
VRSGRVAQDTSVRSQPGGEVVGELPAGALAIVTDSGEGHYRIVFAGAPGGYGWVAQEAVSFASQQPAGRSDPVATLVQEPTPVETRPTAQPAPPSARPAGQPPLPGKLVFQTSNGGDIYLINADGSGLRRLTHGFEPALSPDGRQVAFTRWDEPRGLWLINVDGTSGRHLVTANRARSPAWTPDGQAIVFERSAGEFVCRQSPFGCLSDAELLALFGGQSCVTTPLGTLCIADFPLVTLNYTGLLYYDLASGATRDLATSNTASAPRHTPDGATLIYLDRSGLALARSTGDGTPQPLVGMPPLLGPAAYSPDGQFIYAARFAGNRWDLWRWRADGSQAVALTAPEPLASNVANQVAPVGSPDGRSVAFLTDRAGRWELWVMNSDGANPRPLAPQALAGITLQFDFNSDRVVDWGW